ncbi:MAG: proline dehydrogenase family protein [Candidatus Neomarinimicrobiota bacterium]
MRSLLLRASENPTIAHTFPRYPSVRRAVTRFMPGEKLADALKEAAVLRESNISTVLTYLGEDVSELTEARRVTDHYHEVLDRISKHHLDCHISVKLTQLGLVFDREFCLSNLMSLVEQAADLDNFVWIDMEESCYVDATLTMHRRVKSHYSSVGVCLQSYLFRTSNDFGSLRSLESAIRLVKGAYAEPPDVAYPRKKEVDENFLVLATSMLQGVREGGLGAAFATHDLKLIRRICEEASFRGIPGELLEFQMLYGIKSEEQARLVRQGYGVRVLISYGSAWFPWYMRRLAERPANIFFLVRNLFPLFS